MSKFSPVSYKTLCRVLEAEGFRLIRQEGDHLVYTSPGVLRPVVIPKYSSVPVFIIKNNIGHPVGQDRHVWDVHPALRLGIVCPVEPRARNHTFLLRFSLNDSLF